MFKPTQIKRPVKRGVAKVPVVMQMEALIGWLYVTGQRDRMNELLELALPGIRE